MWAYLAPGVAPMPPVMDLHRICMDFAAQGDAPAAGGQHFWRDGNIAFGTLNVNILMCLLTFAV